MKNKMNMRNLLLIALLALLVPVAAQAMESEECLECHSDAEIVGEELSINADLFDTTLHAELGCPSCHESVSDEHPDDGAQISKAVCLDCHGEINEQYASSSHAENASCGECHNPHQVRALSEVSGHDMNQQCASCHEPADVAASHDSWLPQAKLHIAMLPCISCHTASEEYVIILNIIQRESSVVQGDFELSKYAELQAMAGDQDVQRMIDLNQDDFISLTELRTFNRNPAYKEMRLQGTLTPKDVSHNFATLENRWDCSFCHASGPEAMQTSFLALPTETGTYQRVAVERGAVLKALNGTPDFYMMGATRSASLNIIGILIIFGGCLMPIGHGTLRFLTRKNRAGKGE